MQRNEKLKNLEHSQSFIWDYNTAFMEEDKTYAYLQDELGSSIRLLELGETEETKQMVYGYDEFGMDTYKTQGKIQPFGYTGYRYGEVADTYFAQAREYMQGVGRFGGEDWIKGNIDKPFSLNQYGYCWGNPVNWIDKNGKYPETPLPNFPAMPVPRKYAENDVLNDTNLSPYVGVFYLNIISGAGVFGHVAMLLVRSDDTGDLYSFVGTPSLTAATPGYNDANVNYSYGLDIGEVVRVGNRDRYEDKNKDSKGEYMFEVKGRDGKTFKDEYNRGIYFPINNEQGKAIANAAKETILNVNGEGIDNPDYDLTKNNCDINARKWMQAGGINLETGGHIAPNQIYEYNVGQINIGRKVKYVNAQYGDLYDIWKVLHQVTYFTTMQENKCESCK